MAFEFIWLSGNPEVESHLRKAREARAAAFYATYKALGRAASVPLRRLFKWVGHTRRVRKTRRELSALSPHLLQDIGIARGDIPAVAEALAARAPKSGLTLRQLRRAEIDDPAGSEVRAVPLTGNAQTRPASSQATAAQPVDHPTERERLAA